MSTLQLLAADGHRLSAWIARPEGRARGAVVVVQEIFGVNSHIPLADVEAVRKAYPSGVYHLYAAGHGFNCSDRADYDAASAHLAFERTIEFFHEHVG
jgi:carboxymethylenebutenolidase